MFLSLCVYVYVCLVFALFSSFRSDDDDEPIVEDEQQEEQQEEQQSCRYTHFRFL